MHTLFNVIVGNVLVRYSTLIHEFLLLMYDSIAWEVCTILALSQYRVNS